MERIHQDQRKIKWTEEEKRLLEVGVGCVWRSGNQKATFQERL